MILDLDTSVIVRRRDGQQTTGIIVELPNASGYYGVILPNIRPGDEWGWGPVWYSQADQLSILQSAESNITKAEASILFPDTPFDEVVVRCLPDDPCDVHSPCPAHAEQSAVFLTRTSTALDLLQRIVREYNKSDEEAGGFSTMESLIEEARVILKQQPATSTDLAF